MILQKIIDPEILNFKGKIDLKHAKHTFGVLEYYGPMNTYSEEPLQMYLGRWVIFFLHCLIFYIFIISIIVPDKGYNRFFEQYNFSIIFFTKVLLCELNSFWYLIKD